MRRIVMPAHHKLVALLLATWADPDGSRVRPGMALLGAAMGRSERTAAAVVRSLCGEWGLIEQVARGGGRGRLGRTTEYRLSIPTDLMDRVRLLGPDGLPETPEAWTSGQSLETPEVLASGQSTSDDETPEAQASGQSDPPTVDNSETSEVQDSGQSPVDNSIDRKSDSVTDLNSGSFQRLTGSSALPTTTHVTNHQKTTTAPTGLPTQPPTARDPTSRNDHAAVDGEPDDEPVPRPTLDDLLPLRRPPKPPRPARCPHGLRPGRRADGQPRCPHCRRGLPAANPPESP